MMAERTRVCCLKYSFMACNAFGIMLGIFVVLFGVSYPEVGFPGGYTGKTTACISGVFIFFTLIGYCGAHHQKAYFLVVYALIILVFIFGNVVTCLWMPDITIFDIHSRTFWIVTGGLAVIQLIACVLAYKVWKGRDTSNTSEYTPRSRQPSGTSVKTQMQPSSSNSFISIPRFVPMSIPKGY